MISVPQNAADESGRPYLWRLLQDKPAAAAWNMAADESMMLSCLSGESLPTLRFYGWSPPAVSIGYFQKLSTGIDQAACLKLGIEIIRRLTGGRAVFHDQELTYSLVVNEAAAYIPQTVTKSYCFFSRAIIAGLATLGIDAQMQYPELLRKKSHTSRSAACFDAPSHYEITVAGRKLVGSAQVRRDGVLLQHGSILLSLQPERIAEVLQPSEVGCNETLAEKLADQAIGLDEIMGGLVDPVDLASAIRSGFEEQCGINFRADLRTESEQNRIDELVANKYSAKAWNFLR